MQDQTLTLFALVGLQFALYAAAWFVYARFGADDREAAAHWGAFNALVGSGILLVLLRDDTRGWWAYVGSSLCLLGAFLVGWRGVAALMHAPQQLRLQISVFAVAAGGVLWAGPGLEHAPVRVFFTYVGGAVMIVAGHLQFGDAVLAEFKGRFAAVLRATTLGTALVLALRGLQQLLWPDHGLELQAGEAANLPQFLAFLVMAAGFNFSCLGAQLLRYVRRLRELTLRDPLTGLLNRRAFNDELQREWQRMRRMGAPLVVTAFDLDHFKAINDGHGHDSGDLVLVRVARLLREASREVDLVARLGGEEFAVVMPGTTLEQGLLVAERMRQGLASLPLLSQAGAALCVTVSVGVADALDGDGDAHATLRRADEALYRAKRDGRNRVCQALTG